MNTHAQKNENKNPLICNPETGVCELPIDPNEANDAQKIKAKSKPVKVIYYTDPICSSCWGIEPQLRKLKLEYGGDVEIEYRMGGLLPDWSYNSGGISKPSDVAHHWDEVSLHYDMPIDGDVWLQDPLSSSYPASIAFKAAQLQDNDKAILFLREVRIMVFIQRKNISKWEHLEAAAINVGLDKDQFKKDYDTKAKDLFQEDLKLGRELRVRSFPTMFFTNNDGNTEIVIGTKPYVQFENAVLKLHSTSTKKEYDKTWKGIFSKYNSLTAKEFSVLTDTPRSKSEEILDDLTAKGHLEKQVTKNGSIWNMKKCQGSRLSST